MIFVYLNLKGFFSVNDGGLMGVFVVIEGFGKDIKLMSVDGVFEVIVVIQKLNLKFIEMIVQFLVDQVCIVFGIVIVCKWGVMVLKVIFVDVKVVDCGNVKGFSW